MYSFDSVPAFVFGAIMGPLAINWLDSRKWGSAIIGQVPDITLGMTRVVIGVQLVMAGYQLPARYVRYRWKEMFIILIVVMTLMWLCTAACMMALVPKISLLAGLAIGALVTSTDPVLSQAVAKGPFADKYGTRPPIMVHCCKTDPSFSSKEPERNHLCRGRC
jgi:sodium/hydrogen antiporter